LTDVIVWGSKPLKGVVRAPPSKSMTHRAFIAATLSSGLSIIRDPLICDDTNATINACRMLGAKIRESEGGVFEVEGCHKILTPENIIDCGDSASTMRFLTPVCALADGISILTGGASLRRRPMKPLLEAMKQLGVQCYSARGDGYPPIIVFGGGIRGGRASMPGDVSSQFISGLLFASPMAEGDTCIELSTELESKPYVLMTIDILRRHKVKVEMDPSFKSFYIPSSQEYAPSSHMIEGDYSSASFILVAAAITDSTVKITNLKGESIQGDRFIIDILRKAGVKLDAGENFVRIREAERPLQPINVDLRDHPDLIPVCAVLASYAEGKSVIHGIKRLRFKESDRVAALMSEISKMGVKIQVLGDAMEIEGCEEPRGADFNSYNDHRIAMACIAYALGAKGKSVIHDVECINKSYPNFIRDITLLGADILER